MKSTLEKIGFNIKQLRKINKLSQTELGKLINVSSVAISTWEKGKADPSSTNIIALANVFNVSTDEILNFKNSNIIKKFFSEKHFNNCVIIEDENMLQFTLKK
jgi:hypothetical protein